MDRGSSKECGQEFGGRKRVEVWTDGLSRRCPYCKGGDGACRGAVVKILIINGKISVVRFF